MFLFLDSILNSYVLEPKWLLAFYNHLIFTAVLYRDTVIISDLQMGTIKAAQRCVNLLRDPWLAVRELDSKPSTLPLGVVLGCLGSYRKIILFSQHQSPTCAE